MNISPGDFDLVDIAQGGAGVNRHDNFAAEVLSLPIQQVKARDDQVRTIFSNIDDLAASIAKHGQQQPIVVDPADEHGFYFIQSGERRFRACKKLGINVLAVINDRENKNSELRVLQFIENVQRENLTPFETAYALQKIMEETGCSKGDLAEKVSKSAAYISQHMALLSLPDDVKTLADELKINDRNLLVEAKKLHDLKPKLAVKMLTNKASREEIKKARAKLKNGKAVRAKREVPSMPESGNFIMIKSGRLNGLLSHHNRPCSITDKVDHDTAEIRYTDTGDLLNVRVSELQISGFGE